MGSAAGRKNPITSGAKIRPPPPPSYWVSQSGRNAAAAAASVTAGVVFGGYTVLHTFVLEKYKKVVHLYKHGFPTPLTPSVVVRCAETLEEVKLEGKGPQAYSFFSVFGMDMFHAGSTKMRGGCIVGIPRHFTYDSEDDIERHDIMVENKHVEWGSEGGELLKNSLILSERAQKFAIAREIFMTDTYSPWVYGGIGATPFMTYYLITRNINDRFSGFARPTSFRVLVYTLVGTFTFGLWATMTDFATKYYENWADEAAGSVGLDYAKGGVEFYSKILERNMALRSLMGPKGEKLFTFYGNDVESIRQKHVPYTERKLNMETLAEKLYKTYQESRKDSESQLNFENS